MATRKRAFLQNDLPSIDFADLTEDDLDALLALETDDEPTSPAAAGPALFQPLVTKAAISIRLDRDILDFFRSGGPGYQRRINLALRAYMDAAIAVQGEKPRRPKK